MCLRSFRLIAVLVVIGFSGVASSLRAGDASDDPLAFPGMKEVVLDGALTSLERETKHTVRLQKGRHYGLQLNSRGFFASARLEDAQGKTLESFAGFTMIEVPADGIFHVVVHCSSGSCGMYTLGVQQVAPPGPPQLLMLAKEGLLTLQETLAKTDPIDKVRKRACKCYELNMTAGKLYTIDMISNKFDTFLRLEDVTGKQLAQDDDSGGNNNARLKFRPKADGLYRIIATSYAGGAGAFTLKVREE